MSTQEDSIKWGRYPLVAATPAARQWLEWEDALGRAPNTIDAYARGLEDYFDFCRRASIDVLAATKLTTVQYIRDLRGRPNPRGQRVRHLASGPGLATATMRLRLVAVRLYYDHLIYERLCERNPVPAGEFVPGGQAKAGRRQALIPHSTTLPWIPNEEEYAAILRSARLENARNRFMFALGYEGGLRREELVALAVRDLDPPHRSVAIRAETTKSRAARVVNFSARTAALFAAYMDVRGGVNNRSPALFLSEARRNRGEPVSIHTWTKVVEKIAARAGVPQFTTHTLRHLCLTDLARAGWELHEIAKYAGHRDTATTLQYIHLNADDLGTKLARTAEAIRHERVRLLALDDGGGERW